MSPPCRCPAVTPEHTAYHEAGHVVADFALGLQPIKVTIVADPQQTFLGCTYSPPPMRYEYRTKRERRSIARDIILGCYAGMEAELILDPEADRERGAHDDARAFEISSDEDVLPRRCSSTGDEAHHAYLNRLRAEARRLIRNNWSAVEVVAKLLLHKKTIEADELKALGEKLFPEP